jgi:PPM family protein phosphatase
MVSSQMKAVGLTHIGLRRQRNEDAFRILEEEGVLLIADGMGGHPAGDVASRIAIGSAIRTVRDGGDFHSLLEPIQNDLNEYAAKNPRYWRFGTTLTAVRIAGDRADLVHIGDSRAYRFMAGKLTPLTTDYSYVGELVRAGSLTREQARVHPQSNIITSCLCGDGRELDEHDRRSFAVEPGTRILLCTDGLTDLVPELRLEELLAGDNIAVVAQTLVDEALKAGGRDNITVVIAEVADA